MYEERFIIADNLIIATNNPVRTAPFAVTIINSDGWDDTPSTNRKSVKSLLSNKEFYTKNSTFAGKYFSIDLFANYPSTTSVRNLRSQLLELALRINSPFNIQKVYYKNKVEYFREKMSVLPDNNFISEWQPLSNSVNLTLGFYAPDPFKTIYLNGNTNAEATRRL